MLTSVVNLDLKLNLRPINIVEILDEFSENILVSKR
jgi:hypothetical protein